MRIMLSLLTVSSPFLLSCPPLLSLSPYPSLTHIYALLLTLSFLALIVSGNRLPSFNSFIRSLTASKRTVSSKSQHEAPPTDPLAIVLTNPFVACPLFISGAILFVGLVLAP
jgi:hypothetical protein